MNKRQRQLRDTALAHHGIVMGAVRTKAQRHDLTAAFGPPSFENQACLVWDAPRALFVKDDGAPATNEWLQAYVRGIDRAGILRDGPLTDDQIRQAAIHAEQTFLRTDVN